MTMFSKKNAVRAVLSFITTVTLLLSAQSTIAADEIVLAQTSGCLACHRGLEQRIGPPFKKVAEKYAGQKDAKTMSLLVDHVINGTGPNGVGWMKDGLATLPFMPPNSNVTPKDANKLLRWVLATTGEIANPTEFVTESVAISGAVEHPLKLSVDDLRKFPPKKVGEVPMVCQSGANLGQLEHLKGVLLRDILEKAVVVSHNHNDVKKMAIIATASDGYKVVFSWTEVFNSPMGDGVIVFFEKDGKALGDDEGRIAMVSTKDTRTGPRHVKWLQGIEVRKIVD